MTPLLVTALVLLALYAVYIAALVARTGAPPAQFLDAGAALPGWAVAFAGAGLVVAGLQPGTHLALVARYGLQASHVAIGLVLAALVMLLVQKRLWLAARIAGMTSPGEALGRYYDSVALRVAMLALTVLFALPFAADILSQNARLLEAATGGQVPRQAGIWVLAFCIAVPAIVGGWRATVLVLAMQAVLLAVLIAGLTLFAEATLPAAVPLMAEGILWDRIPGVIQYSAGIGKEVPQGGLFTTTAIASGALALTGIVLSPGFLYLGQTVRAGRSAGFSGVWLIAGLGAGLLLLAGPVLAARLGGGPVPLAEALFALTPFAGIALVLMLLVAGQMAAGFFVTSGTLLLTRELVVPYILPGLDARAQRLAARIGLGFAVFALAMLAAFAPLVSAVLASVALPLSVQLLPALIGLCFLRWISRGAVLAGLVFGTLLVLFTEPPGLILFEGLFLDLPWGRWPLTVHSAAWGLAFNLGVVLLAAIFTARGPERLHRDRLHDEFARRWPASFGGPGARGALWSLTLIWGFLAYGPGAILGNTFFSDPIFTSQAAALGLPSLWVWQLFFWLLGVLLVWWLGYRVGLGQTTAEGLRLLDMRGPEPILGRRAPTWIAAGLARVTERRT